MMPGKNFSHTKYCWKTLDWGGLCEQEREPEGNPRPVPPTSHDLCLGDGWMGQGSGGGLQEHCVSSSLAPPPYNSSLKQQYHEPPSCCPRTLQGPWTGRGWCQEPARVPHGGHGSLAVAHGMLNAHALLASSSTSWCLLKTNKQTSKADLCTQEGTYAVFFEAC